MAVVGAPVAQWVKRGPTDLAVVSLRLRRLSTSHRPDMTEILFKRT